MKKISTLDEAKQFVQSDEFAEFASFEFLDLQLPREDVTPLLGAPWNAKNLTELCMGPDRLAPGAYLTLAANDTLWKAVRFDFGDHGSEQLIEFLRLPISRAIISWHHSEIREAAAGLALSPRLENIEVLDLCGMFISRPWFGRFLASPHLCNVVELRLYTCGGPASDWRQPLHLHRCRRLEVQGSEDTLAAILSSPDLPALREIKLYQHNLEDDHVPVLEHRRLTGLALSNDTSSTVPLARSWFDWMVGSSLPSLTDLSLRRYSLEDVDFESLGTLPPGRQLRHLEFSDTSLAPSHLWRILENARSLGLESLALDRCGLAKTELHAALTRNPDLAGLTAFSLRGNPLGQRGGKLIQKFLQKMPALEKLDVSNTCLSLPDFTALGKGLASSGVSELLLGGNHLNDAKLAAIFESAPPRIRALSLACQANKSEGSAEEGENHFTVDSLRLLEKHGLWSTLAELNVGEKVLGVPIWNWLELAPPSSIRRLALSLGDEEHWRRFTSLRAFPHLEEVTLFDHEWVPNLEPGMPGGNPGPCPELRTLLKHPTLRLIHVRDYAGRETYETSYLRERLACLDGDR